MTTRILRTAVAEFGGETNGVLEIKIVDEVENLDDFLTIGNQDGEDSVIVSTEAQARQLIEALNAGIEKLWE